MEINFANFTLCPATSRNKNRIRPHHLYQIEREIVKVAWGIVKGQERKAKTVERTANQDWAKVQIVRLEIVESAKIEKKWITKKETAMLGTATLGTAIKVVQ